MYKKGSTPIFFDFLLLMCLDVTARSDAVLGQEFMANIGMHEHSSSVLNLCVLTLNFALSLMSCMNHIWIFFLVSLNIVYIERALSLVRAVNPFNGRTVVACMSITYPCVKCKGSVFMQAHGH